MRGNGDGTFQPRTIVPGAGYAAWTNVVAADLNSDGHLDLAVTERPGEESGNAFLYTYVGDGTGNFHSDWFGTIGGQWLGQSTSTLFWPLMIAGPFIPGSQQLIGSATYPLDTNDISLMPIPTYNVVSASATISNITIPTVLPATQNLQCSYAGDANYLSSISAQQSITLPSAATPTIQPPTGAYAAPFQATISDGTPGVTIYYTTDGTAPTTSSPQYTGPINVSGSETIQAIASSTSYLASPVVSAAYTLETKTSAPLISPAAGIYRLSSPGLQVTITAASGATIYYTTDGTTPTTSSAQYTVPFTIVQPVRIVRAIAQVSGQINSAVSSAVYDLNVAETVMQNITTGQAPICSVNGLTAFSSTAPTGSVTFQEAGVPLKDIGTSSLSQNSGESHYMTYSENLLPKSTAAFLAPADFNADGKPDLAVSTDSGISTLLGNGDGTFQPAVPIAGTGLSKMVTGDINNDGKLDLITLTGTSSYATMLGNGDGTFQAPIFHALGVSSPAGGIVGGNFGNGKFDLAITSGNQVYVLFGNGDGTFQSPVTYLAGNGAGTILAADFNGDGKLDLLVGNNSDASVSALLGLGDGTFQIQILTNVWYQTWSLHIVPSRIITADFNRDGNTDLLIIGWDSGGPRGSEVPVLMLGNGDGTFQSAHLITPGVARNTAMATGDFNKDGIPDIALGQVGTKDSLGVWLGNGDGTFAPPYYDPNFSFSNINDLVAVDFNGKGYSNLALAQTSRYDTSVRAGFETPYLSSFAVLNNFWLPQGASPLVRTYVCTYSGDSNYEGSTSNAVTYTFLTLAPPAISLVPGASNTVTISGDSGATYFYTTDGTTPTTSSTQYTGPVPVSATTTFTAIAAEAGYVLSSPSQAKYTAVDTPAFSLPAGKYTPGQTVTMTVSTANSTIYYTTDGSVPTIKSAAYTAPVVLSGNVTLKAIGTSPGHISSAVASATYTTNLADTKTALASSARSVGLNQQLTLTATVTGSSPTGSVTFTAGSTTLGKADISNGSAALKTSFAVAGTYSVTAKYSGDSNNAASTSSALTVTVAPNASKTTVEASATSVNTGQKVTLTATVTGSSPTGSVTFSAGSTTLGKANVSNDAAALETSFATAGTYSITASYSGDTNNAASTSSAVSITVTAAAPSYTVSANPTTQTIAAGQSATYKITVKPVNGYSAATTFTCSALPREASCSFNPTKVTPNGSSVSTMLTISTTAPVAMLDGKPGRGLPPWVPAGSLALAGLIGVFAAPRRTRRLRALLRALSCVLLLTSAVMAASACGGGSSSGGGGGQKDTGTPKGSYSVTVNASGTSAQSLNLTLVVQ